jgi:hypothetical protein
MTGLVRKATLLCVGGALLAGAAMAGVPSAANSIVPSVTGCPGTACVVGAMALMDFRNTIDPIGTPNIGACIGNAMHITVRDGNNNPVAGSSVVVDFSGCYSPGQPAGNFKLGSVQADPAITTVCGTRTVTKAADANGDVCFTIIGNTDQTFACAGAPPNCSGGGGSRDDGPGAGAVCAKVYADAVLLGTALCIVNRYDLNLDSAVNAGDSSLLTDLKGEFGAGGSPGYRTFGDYNADGAVNAADSSIQSDAKGNYGQGVLVYGGAYCP